MTPKNAPKNLGLTNQLVKPKQAETREFEFTPHDFARVRKLIYQQAGISLSDAKSDMVYSRLGRRLRLLDLTSFNVYLDQLEQTNDPEEWEAFVNALTTNLTSFFREEHHFPILADHLLTLKKPIRIWCSAASTGEEPYTIAMTACQVFGTMTPPIEIIATDIDTNVLATAARGVYPIERIAKLPADVVKQYFQRGVGAQEGSVRVRNELKALIEFKQLNLLADHWALKESFDVIFCRNVMIYFDKPTQTKILSRFATLMKPHALLFAGHSENFTYISNVFKLRGKTVYALNDLAAKSTKIKETF